MTMRFAMSGRPRWSAAPTTDNATRASTRRDVRRRRGVEDLAGSFNDGAFGDMPATIGNRRAAAMYADLGGTGARNRRESDGPMTRLRFMCPLLLAPVGACEMSNGVLPDAAPHSTPDAPPAQA